MQCVFVVFSALTLGILKWKYLSHVGGESLSPEAKTCIKRVVEEELLNMQVFYKATNLPILDWLTRSAGGGLLWLSCRSGFS